MFKNKNAYIDSQFFKYLMKRSYQWRVGDLDQFKDIVDFRTVIRYVPYSQSMPLADLLPSLSNYRLMWNVGPIVWNGGPEKINFPKFRELKGTLNHFVIDELLSEVCQFGGWKVLRGLKDTTIVDAYMGWSVGEFATTITDCTYSC